MRTGSSERSTVSFFFIDGGGILAAVVRGLGLVAVVGALLGLAVLALLVILDDVSRRPSR